MHVKSYLLNDSAPILTGAHTKTAVRVATEACCALLQTGIRISTCSTLSSTFINGQIGHRQLWSADVAGRFRVLETSKVHIAASIAACIAITFISSPSVIDREFVTSAKNREF